MQTRRIYIGGLVGFLLLGGMFGFRATPPHKGVILQETPLPVDVTPVAPGATSSVGIPVTAEPEPVWIEILVFYGLIGLTALFLILALLNLANKATAPYPGHKNSTADKTHRR